MDSDGARPAEADLPDAAIDERVQPENRNRCFGSGVRRTEGLLRPGDGGRIETMSRLCEKLLTGVAEDRY